MESLNYSVLAKFSLPAVFINKVFSEHSHTHLFHVEQLQQRPLAHRGEKIYNLIFLVKIFAES